MHRPHKKADEQRDVIEVNGEKLCFQKFVYIMMNKPQGVISSTDGRKTAEKTVIDILPAEMKRKGLFPAGRLDKKTPPVLCLSRMTALLPTIF
ncbi:MAG: pseudouridine synthase [Anaerotruncus sp.]|nr:MAG: pseudouridine synthase [Anaerotruncus sp.]